MPRFDAPRALLAAGCLLASVASVAAKRRRALLAAALLAVLAAILWLPSPALAAPDSCPFSGGGAPYAFQSWEAGRDRSLYLDAQRLAAQNELFPDDEEFALPTLMAGTGSARREDPLATIPAPLLFAIGWVESSTNQTAIGVPYGSTGPALISFDCGYGIMQITSKIINDGDPPTRFEALVGTHFAYNIAAGAQVLAEAWNEQFFPVVGDADPSRIESWYYALWAYNGWALENHPAGPDVDPFRAPEYRCDGHRAGYAYQELVLGCIAHPPEVDGRPLWEAVDVALPDLGALAAQGGPLDPAHFYAGWNRLRSSGFVLDMGASAFAEMNMPLPAASRIHGGPGPRRRGGAAAARARRRRPAARARCGGAGARFLRRFAVGRLAGDRQQRQRAAALARRRRAVVAGVRCLGRRRGRWRRRVRDGRRRAALGAPGARLRRRRARGRARRRAAPRSVARGRFNDRADCYRLPQQARRSVLPRRHAAELRPRPCSSTDRAADF